MRPEAWEWTDPPLVVGHRRRQTLVLVLSTRAEMRMAIFRLS